MLRLIQNIEKETHEPKPLPAKVYKFVNSTAGLLTFPTSDRLPVPMIRNSDILVEAITQN